ncbi:MAG: phosphate/phosphite/phosphonate ABC transporter substrate-binding protein [Raineya sp.]|nr:phosphate/phosphite/phosphonate ABC transporter substrate-binding protein [Raineya sp.]
MKKLFIFWIWCCCSLAISQNIPKELIVAIGHTKMDKQGVQIDKPLQEYLQKKLQMPVKVFYPKNVFEMLDKVDSGKIHVIDVNPFGYVMASLNGKVDVIAIRGDKNQKIETYNSCLLVNAKSPVKTLADLKKMGSKLEMAFVNPASTSGHLVPRLYLNSQKIDAETIFKDVTFKGTHANVAEYIQKTPNAVGACAYSYLQDQINAGKFKKEDFRILWISPEIPHGPVAILKELDAGFRQKVQEAFLSIPREAPELWQMIVSNWNAKVENVSYIKGDDKAFDNLRKITNEAEDLILILNFYRD